MCDPLFTPLKLGDIVLNHRVIMAPLTRYRAAGGIPGALMTEYYLHRSSKGGLLITEATSISNTSGMQPDNPRIDTNEAIAGWRKIVDAVHSKGGYIFLQLNHFGRSCIPKYNQEEVPLCSSSITLSGKPRFYEDDDPNLSFAKPKEMSESDMTKVINEFTTAAYNAVYLAGFDGVEIHGANGYLIDEFLEDNINVRTDSYGGSIENRCRFPLQVLDGVISKLGSPKKVGFRISPWDNFQDADDSDPVGHFSYVCEQLSHRNIAYIHVIEARSDSNGGREGVNLEQDTSSSVSQLKRFVGDTPLVSAGGWNGTNFTGVIAKNGLDCLAFGRYFISNPDLVERLKKGHNLNLYDRTTFYSHLEPKGYIDYPTMK